MILKNWKCIGEKNAALEHCWGVIAARDREIAALRKLLQRVLEWDEEEPLGGSQLLDSIHAALEMSGGAAPDPAELIAKEVGPETEAEIVRDGYFIKIEWTRYGVTRHARIYEPLGMRLSPALADLMALCIEAPLRPALAPAPDPAEDMRAKEAAALIVLAKFNIPTDVQELLVHGNPMRSVAPGALRAALEGTP